MQRLAARDRDATRVDRRGASRFETRRARCSSRVCGARAPHSGGRRNARRRTRCAGQSPRRSSCRRTPRPRAAVSKRPVASEIALAEALVPKPRPASRRAKSISVRPRSTRTPNARGNGSTAMRALRSRTAVRPRPRTERPFTSHSKIFTANSRDREPAMNPRCGDASKSA